MNFTAQLKRGVTAVVVFSAIGLFALTHAANSTSASAVRAVDEVAPTRLDVVTPPTAGAASLAARVHVGRPVLTGANPTPRQIERASR